MAETDGSLIERLAACPLCGCAELTRVSAPPVGIGRDVFAAAAPHLGLSRCAECRLVFVNPRPAPPLLNAFYDRDGYDCHNPHFAAHGAEGDLRARFAALVPHVRRKGTLLDFGAGAGHLMRYAQREGWPRVLGVEVGAPARAALRREGLEVYADLEEARESKAQLDALTMIQVLE
ncbi:MAG TPA: methyltransferase domain-containing protein, partial [Pyrinomonadaceae bacterium]